MFFNGWRHVTRIALLAALVFLVGARNEAKEPGESVMDAFLQSVRNDQEFDAAAQARAVEVVASLRKDPHSHSLAITEGLRELYPDFRVALQLLGSEDLTPAIDRFSQLQDSDDRFLAAESMFYLAQAYTYVERFEDAIPILQQLLKERSDEFLQQGDALFLLGVSQSRVLDRENAIATLTRFLDSYPAAPERMRIGAWRQREELKLIQEGSMADVYDRMDYARRRLQLAESGDETQKQQDSIIAMLDELIEVAEQCECQSGGTGSESQQGDGSDGNQGQGNSEGNRQVRDGIIRRTYQRRPESPWSQLRDRQRDPAYSAIKEKFPDRYEALIEQYYKSFQEESP